ncbi:MinD/ParA family protein [Streptomyces sp. NPDC059009]|uniref:MinD/ParA family ATP-binding protein n=1 Tax=Streptomyces sp. NPDC059009 TaxID=3346694 RepID=UPI0036BED881
MTLIALCSLKGSPGVTTATLALAARWPAKQEPVVVECDPAGGDLLARFRLDMAPGLVSLAASARRSREEGMELLRQHTQLLPGGLPVVAGPPGAEQSRAALGELLHARASVLQTAARRPRTVIVADCGRIEPNSPTLPLVRAADALVLLARARDDALAHVAARIETVIRWSETACFLLVGDGYPTGEVADTLGLRIMGRIPDDPKGAGALCGRPARHSGPDRSALGRAMAKIAPRIALQARRKPAVLESSMVPLSNQQTFRASSDHGPMSGPINGAPQK